MIRPDRRRPGIQGYSTPLDQQHTTSERTDAYFGKVLRDAAPSTRTGRASALAMFFVYPALRHKIELHSLTGLVVECPLEEINRPRASVEPRLRVPPTEIEIEKLFEGWRGELATCRKFGPAARNYAVARLATDVGLRINEAGCSTSTTSGGSWAGSASSTSDTARDRVGGGPSHPLPAVVP